MTKISMPSANYNNEFGYVMCVWWIIQDRPQKTTKTKLTASPSCVQCINDKQNNAQLKLARTHPTLLHYFQDPKEFPKLISILGGKKFSNLEVLNLLHAKTRISKFQPGLPNQECSVTSRYFADIIIIIDRSPFTNGCNWNRDGDNNP